MQKMSITMITILLFVQILSNGFAQIPNTSDEETLETSFEGPSLTSARNDTGGNNTGGNNTGGNNTGANNTGGNNTGGNNTGGNNTGGNNTGGNNTGGNNTGGNNTGGNNTGGNNTGGNNTGGNNTGSNNDSHCLTVGNFAISSTYFVTIDLINTCSFDINYPGINASADDSGVSGFYNQTSWWYMIGANDTYNLSVQLVFDSSVQNGTNITLDFEAVILNCGTNGTWHDCPNSTNSTLSYQFQYTPPPVSLIIYSANLNSDNDRISVVYSSQNYTGYVNWEYNSSNGTSTSSSYTNSYTRTTYIYPSTFGTIQICGIISGDITCVNIIRNVRPLYGEINNPSNNFTTYASSIYINYFAENYTNGMLELNNQTFHYLQSNASNGNNTTFVNLPVGWSTLCLKLTGDNGTSLADCIQIHRQAPVERLIIDSVTLSTNNDYIVLRHHSENYSGYVNWEYNSSNGTSTSSSYTDPFTRTTYIYPSTFGTIQICGTIGNFTTECVSVNRVIRMVEGALISPSNNSQYSTNYLYVTFNAINYSSGAIKLNGANYNDLGSSFYPTNYSGGGMNNSSSSVIYIPYGGSTICLELTGEGGAYLSDCIVVERIVPPHSVLITYPATGASFTGQQLNLSYILENSSSHYLTIDGTTISASNNYSTTALITVGYGTHNVCIVSYDMANQIDSDCVTVNMIDPNADSDSDGIPDHSDLCPSTPPNQSVNVDGCSTSQLDSDSDGVADNVDICPATQQFSTVNSVGCSALQRDSDGDGVMDNLDVCPSSPANSIVDANGCSNTQTDSDNDGIVDASDMCPNTIVGSQVNANGCASSQLDSDSDGIVDSFDLCSNTSIGTVVDQTGCPYSTSGNSSGTNNGSTGGGSSSSGGSSSGGGLPSIGVVGTIAAIAIGFIFTTRREDEE
ncbi:MAG: thrombospondin type 3 repeat-containing protein [archaeon]|nr:thrombospondin type 3 repeat-containing protein [archaeon]